VLVTLCAGLMISSTVLIYNMNLYFDKRLRQEKIRIAAMLIVFTVAYLSRAATYFITEYTVEEPD